jgi:acetyl-CoA acetyltransferase
VIYQQDKTGIPIFNITNNGCTGSTAVLMARNAIKSGAVDCALAIGFEKM